MWSHNIDRPNMALGEFTPKQKLAMLHNVTIFDSLQKEGLPWRRVQIKPF
jgi:hypothetical protein